MISKQYNLKIQLLDIDSKYHKIYDDIFHDIKGSHKLILFFMILEYLEIIHKVRFHDKRESQPFFVDSVL